MGLVVKYAVYGALIGGNSGEAQSFDISQALQQLIN
jgi:hypothetical protein